MIDYSKGNYTPNVPMLTEFKTLKTVVSSSIESETGGTFKNTQNVIPLQHILEKFTHIRNPPNVPQLSQIISHPKASSLVLSNCANQKHWIENCLFLNKYNLYGNKEYKIEIFTSLNTPPEYHYFIVPKYLVHCLTQSPFPHG